MFTKVLIAEDHEHANISVRKTLDDLGIPQREFRFYCDDAFNIFQASVQKEQPFDLLITDLSFEEDKNVQQIAGGRELIKAVRAVQPGIKILVFSLENNIGVVDGLFNDLDIDAYVRKARYDGEDLKRAIDALSNNKKYRSADLMHTRESENSYDFKAYDIEIITLLCNGTPQKNIPLYLQEKNLKPSGLSSVEKRLNAIKTSLNISSNEQLVAYCKDNRII
ncbi:DNA-binding response regulator, NarL/FixJ family, contains REC and HTH domains [Pedobacter westerhofensis]|uniref:DNA-binding response regulator, NarL/FixJ family, contains REC and HTH domains n=1 Tax=Pedobacter westerhofensis TaxID=425512 RepID=A0A521AFK4_9SPHI|nr:response regulator transcription factor [Pedobacter westerhofensis]SMO33490.1 DNA-binding response regulator, NarL/FixJ family, contains REC and HTH domains [Pedobacter westerhofensis]